MTRKKYIRMIMSTGIQRNEAHAVAWMVWQEKIPYETAWRNGITCERNLLIGVTAWRIGQAISKSICQAREAITRFVDGLSAAVSTGKVADVHEDSAGEYADMPTC